MDQALEVAVRTAGPVTIVVASGEVDVATTPILREQLDALVDAGSTKIVLDLGYVSFLDSTGLGALVAVQKLCRDAEGDLQIVTDAPKLLQLFEITGLADSFAVSATVEEALAASA